MFNRWYLLGPTLIAAASCFAAGPVNAEPAQAKPNIILFISDDHGWADSGAYGDDYIQTPTDGDASLAVMPLPVCFVGHTHVPVTLLRLRDDPGLVVEQNGRLVFPQK